jgi:hypothetical protein
MNKRPLSVTTVGWLFIAVGIIGFVYHATEFTTKVLFDYSLVWVQVVRLLAVVGGAYLLRGANWSRWLLLLWLVYHVVLSTLHSVSEAVMHILFLAVIGYVLLRPQASQYFRGGISRSGRADS